MGGGLQAYMPKERAEALCDAVVISAKSSFVSDKMLDDLNGIDAWRR